MHLDDPSGRVGEEGLDLVRLRASRTVSVDGRGRHGQVEHRVVVHVTQPKDHAPIGARRALLPDPTALASYGGRVTSRGPLSLAALASAAVPGLDPDSVEGVVGIQPGHPFDVAFVQDHEHRRWVIRCPRSPAASAQLERSAALLALLARRLTMPVPAVKGWVALPEGGRAAVSTYLTGRMVDLESIAPGSKLAVGLGRALAQLHNLDRQVYEEAGVPVYDAEAYRTRRLAELDRAAATGRVPTGLLGRWERTLEDVSLWRFTTVPTHGGIGPSTVLATPDDGEDPDVKGFLGWESAQVADPADDLAVLVGELHPDTLDTVLEAYAHSRADRPDRSLQQRARLIHEMQVVRTMMTLVAAGDDAGAEEHATQLRRLDERLAAEDEAAEAKAEAAKLKAAQDKASEDEAPQTASVAGPPEAVTEPDDSSDSATVASDAPTSTDTPERDATPTAETSPADTASTDDEEPAVVVEDPGAPTPVQPVPEEGPAVTRRKGTDHETAEIVPINDEDDGDNVISPLR